MGHVTILRLATSGNDNVTKRRHLVEPRTLLFQIYPLSTYKNVRDKMFINQIQYLKYFDSYQMTNIGKYKYT